MARPKRPELQPFRFYLKPSVFKKFKKMCKKKGLYHSDAIAGLMEAWLKQMKTSKKGEADVEHVDSILQRLTDIVTSGKTEEQAEKYLGMKDGRLNEAFNEPDAILFLTSEKE